MKHDTLTQFTNLRRALLSEKADLAARLAAIDKALGNSSAAVPKASSPSPVAPKAKASRKTVRRRKLNRIPGQPSLKDAVRAITAGKPLTKPEIIAALKKSGRKYAPGSLQAALYAKGAFKRADGKFSPA